MFITRLKRKVKKRWEEYPLCSVRDLVFFRSESEKLNGNYPSSKIGTIASILLRQNKNIFDICLTMPELFIDEDEDDCEDSNSFEYLKDSDGIFIGEKDPDTIYQISFPCYPLQENDWLCDGESDYSNLSDLLKDMAEFREPAYFFGRLEKKCSIFRINSIIIPDGENQGDYFQFKY
ncbi:MAG: hypothetical protein PHE43_00995 [Candidatus Nanoarchaeia archaeon]|nr:hypothetical protein [Candidatus Nanoarchaeia archaeon]